MVKRHEVLAVIPARGGSKGIPRKNIKDFAGFPLMVYSIAAAKQSNLVTRVIVSTDDEEIAEIARQWGAETPFLRPEEFARDNTLDLPVMQHCLAWLSENEGYHPDIVLWLRPTSPIRPRRCLDDAIQTLLDHPDADSIRGVIPAAQNPFKMWTLDSRSGELLPLLKVEGIREPYNAPRQMLPDAYWQTGHIDAIWTKTILEKQSMTGDVIFPLMINPRYTVDIDVASDWESAERLLSDDSLEMVTPGPRRRTLPEKISLIVLDFDGVLTDDRVWVNTKGEEMVAASRADGLGLERLRNETEIEVMVLSRETNLVVQARCEKLKLPVLQAVQDKREAIRQVLADKKIPAEEVLFVGNDITDLVVFPEVGFAVAPVDAHQDVIRKADLILSKKGGKGAVRELCDMILSRYKSAG
jgi:N-acylneuraminate cytidylyltransferase